MNYKLFVVVALSCSGCSYRGDVQAPNGYSIECDKGRNCIVASNGPTSVIIEPEVDQGAVVNQHLIGHVTKQLPFPGQTAPDFPTNNPGFFIIDTQSGLWVGGLTEADWKRELAQKGIANSTLEPTAYSPPSNQ